ncbi:alpha/beta fold hydrolase [Spirosoma koreense]
MTNSGWDDWQAYFPSKGYTTMAPAWPFKDGTAAELRTRKPNDTDLANLSLDELVDHCVNIVKGFPEKPIVIGHSLGGLITQIIVNRDLAAAGVAIHSVPPQGLSRMSFHF